MIKMLAASAMLLAIAQVPAAAQLGRLVSTPDLLKFTADTCIAGGSDFQRAVPAAAEKLHWDEYGKKPGTPATTRAWLVAVKGLPVVVDIGKAGSLGMCSVNAVSDPAAVTAAISASRGKPQSSTLPNGDKVSKWEAKGKMPAMKIESSPGRAMARISVIAPAG
jgi:hypothetical protein